MEPKRLPILHYHDYPFLQNPPNSLSPLCMLIYSLSSAAQTCHIFLKPDEDSMCMIQSSQICMIISIHWSMMGGRLGWSQLQENPLFLLPLRFPHSANDAASKKSTSAAGWWQNGHSLSSQHHFQRHWLLSLYCTTHKACSHLELS